MDFEKIAKDLHEKHLHGMHAEDCADMCSEKIAQALEEAFYAGMMHATGSEAIRARSAGERGKG
jgi:hypothetical protein